MVNASLYRSDLFVNIPGPFCVVSQEKLYWLKFSPTLKRVDECIFSAILNGKHEKQGRVDVLIYTMEKKKMLSDPV